MHEIYPLFCHIPSEISTLTQWKEFLDDKRINFLFFAWKLLSRITVQMLAYRCDLNLSGTDETHWLCQPLQSFIKCGVNYLRNKNFTKEKNKKDKEKGSITLKNTFSVKIFFFLN